MDVRIRYWYESSEDKYHLHVNADDDCLDSHTKIDLVMVNKYDQMQNAGILKTVMMYLKREHQAKFQIINGPESFGDNVRKLNDAEENAVLEALGGIPKQPAAKS